MKRVTILRDNESNNRIQYGLERITNALEEAGYKVETQVLTEYAEYREYPGEKLYVGVRNESAFLNWLEQEELLLYHTEPPKAEGFYLSTVSPHLTVIAGTDPTGCLYGCLEWIDRFRKEGEVPMELAFTDQPAFKLRGPVLGLQKTHIEPPRRTYEYPITPDRFPWFYDKEQWMDYLEMMVENRCNVLYIWSGHPFASLVRVPEYPEALEVTEEELEKNREVFLWLTEECDRRGIWVVLKFYNIHIPYEFAVYHGLDPHQTSIHPLVADYTRKSIAAFIRSYPHIGLMVCLGEALRGLEAKTQWFVETIIPGVKDGIREAGLTEEPPLILRGHDCDPVDAMNKALPLYHNLYTMWKYNGEGLTTYEPRGNWQKEHQQLSALGGAHIINVHIVADLEPFRYMAPRFIQHCVQASAYRLGGNSLHLYPLFYWDWPYAADKTEPRTMQIIRDRLWYDTWFRYAWNPYRDEETEQLYWRDRLQKKYGCDPDTAALFLDAVEAAGQLAPRSLRRVGITEGNRQTWSLGMSMSELTNVVRYRPNRELWNSVGGRGEQPDLYAEREVRGIPHFGETPLDMVEDTDRLASRAWKAVQNAEAGIRKEQADFEGWKNDIRALCLITESYNRKIEAACEVLKYKYSVDGNMRGDLNLLKNAASLLEKSLLAYREVTELTSKTYLYAQSMITPQRKIPFPNAEVYGHWKDCLPEYEKEYRNLCRHIEEMEAGRYPQSAEETDTCCPLIPASFTLEEQPGLETYTVQKGEAAFAEDPRNKIGDVVPELAAVSKARIMEMIPELSGLTGIRFSLDYAVDYGIHFTVDLAEDSRILIGYFQDKAVQWLKVPDLETNTHADDRGGLEPVYKNGMNITGCPKVNFHMLRYEKGRHELAFDQGAFLVAGVIKADQPITPRNAEIRDEALESLDWLYED